MSLIIGENVSQQFGAQDVLKGLSFRVADGDRIGFVGPNGEGKTTLLRVISGLLDPTLGAVHRRRGLRVGYLPQDPPAIEGTTIRAAMLDVFADVRRMEDEMHELSTRLSEPAAESNSLERYGELQARFEAEGGYSYALRIEQVLTGLGFERDAWDRPLDKLSGGQRTRACLAKLLLSNPHMLLLDEPTNHLDLDAVEWLEGWLASFKGAMIVVSHDRWFLDHVTTSTWEISFGGLEAFPAAYSAYRPMREQRHLEISRRYESQQEYIAKTQDFIRQHIAGQRTREARGRRKRLERFIRDEALDRPRDHDEIHLSLSTGGRTGDVVMTTDALVVGYDPAKPLVAAGRLRVERGQRIAVVGPNGIGKTTLMRTLLGELEPLEGTVRVGSNVDAGYLSQTHAELDPECTALDAVLSAEKGLTDEVVRTLLGSLLLSGDDTYKKIGELSGGQRSRVILARLVVQSANVLMLDEPTNHLDIPSTEIIQDVLKRFDGTVLFITHDRCLIDAVATDVWVVEPDAVHCIHGGWEKYIRWRETRAKSDSPELEAKDTRRAEHEEQRRRTNLMQRLKRRHEEIETEIGEIEERLGAINREISSASAAGELRRVEQLGLEYQEKDARLKTLWAEWEEIGGKLE